MWVRACSTLFHSTSILTFCPQDDFSLNAMLYLMSRTVLNCACGGFCFPALLGVCSNGFVDSGKCLCTLFMGLIPLSCFGTKFNSLHLERYVKAKSGLIWLWQSTSVQDCKSSFLIDLHWDSTKSFNGGYCCIKSCFFPFSSKTKNEKWFEVSAYRSFWNGLVGGLTQLIKNMQSLLAIIYCEGKGKYESKST